MPRCCSSALAGSGRSSANKPNDRRFTMELDTSTVVTALATATAAIGLIGAAKMLPNAAIKAWTWITAAIRGG
nr:major capsid protein [Xanthomonas translucens]